jgi:hypothetical protein
VSALQTSPEYKHDWTRHYCFASPFPESRYFEDTYRYSRPYLLVHQNPAGVQHLINWRITAFRTHAVRLDHPIVSGRRPPRQR